MSEFTYLEIVGIGSLVFVGLKLTISVLKGFWTTFLGYKLGFGIEWIRGDNVWAVVTGATDGIGLQYAKQMAQKGYNLVIISRNEDKLMATQKSLLNDYKDCKQVKTIAADFSRTDIYDKIAKELNQLEVIDVLVNNVGIVYHIPEYFLKIGSAFNEQYLNVNCVSALKMSEIVLPKMCQNRRGIIINISSAIGEAPIPLYTTYGASKAFHTFLSEALSVEYESKGIYIQTVSPNQVSTKITTNVTLPIIAVTPEDFVSAAIRTVGIEHYTNGHWKHKLFAYVTHWGLTILGQRLYMKAAMKASLDMRQQYYTLNNLNDG